MSTMVKSKEAKLENANPMIVGQVKLSNGFEDQKSSPFPNEETKEKTSRGETSGEKPGNLTSFLLMELKNDNTNDRVVQCILEYIATFPKKKAINDPMVKNSPQNLTYFDSNWIGKEKGVVQDTLQDRISSVATKKRNTPIWFRLVASNQEYDFIIPPFFLCSFVSIVLDIIYILDYSIIFFFFQQYNCTTTTNIFFFHKG